MKFEHWTLEQYRRYVSTGQEPPKPPKYHNIQTEVDGIRFDSKKEARRYAELKYLQEREEITDLRLQAEFTLQEAFTDISGKRVRAIRYRADFTYRQPDGTLVVEDVKSEATKQNKTYIMKKKMLKDRFGIDVKEV